MGAMYLLAFGYVTGFTCWGVRRLWQNYQNT